MRRNFGRYSMDIASIKYCIDVGIETFKKIIDRDNEGEDLLYEWLETINGVLYVDYNGHFGPYIYIEIEYPKTNDPETWIQVRTNIDMFLKENDMNEEKLYELIEYLRGTCHSIYDAFEVFGEDFDTVTTETLNIIDENIFCCGNCQWWYEISEVAEDWKNYHNEPVCQDCVDYYLS